MYFTSKRFKEGRHIVTFRVERSLQVLVGCVNAAFFQRYGYSLKGNIQVCFLAFWNTSILFSYSLPVLLSFSLVTLPLLSAALFAGVSMVDDAQQRHVPLLGNDRRQKSEAL
jgi:hypothetical protein